MASDIVSPDFSPAEVPGGFTPATRDIATGSSTVYAAVKERVRRWRAVPSRALERVCRALLQCEGSGYAGGRQLSKPARAVLNLLSAGLDRSHPDGRGGSAGSGDGS